MSIQRRAGGVLAAILLAMPGTLRAEPETAVRTSFVTLGTFAGQVPSPVRAQPANLIRRGDQTILVDAGDGVSGQLAKAGVPLTAVNAVFISHLHYDHTGGLFGFLGLRRRSSVSPIVIYGPPGTKRLVDGLIAAMGPATELGIAAGMGATRTPMSENAIQVIELRDGAVLALGDAKVTVATNSHYTLPVGSPEAVQFLSLSFRFDFPDRSIVYTGDTGPSENVDRLAKGADLLVSEISDPDCLISAARKAGRILTGPALESFDHHMRKEHLTPEAVGRLAARAGAKQLVVTHIGLGDCSVEQASERLATQFSGPFVFAKDLDIF